MSTYTLKEIDQLAHIHHGAVKLAGAELGVRSFGMQILDFPAGFDAYPEHDHSQDGQEEVYLVLEGNARFEIDGQPVALDPGRVLRVDAQARRRLEPGPSGVRLLALGGTPGALYERPQDFELAARA